MKLLTRLLGCAAVSVLFAGLVLSLSARGESLGQLSRWLALETRRGSMLGERRTAIEHNLEVKKAVINALLADRLTFAEAVEQFRAANAEVADGGGGLVAPYHTPRTEEGVRRQVLAWIHAELPNRPEEVARALARLEQEPPTSATGPSSSEMNDRDGL
jgi:hypothetical protein